MPKNRLKNPLSADAPGLQPEVLDVGDANPAEEGGSPEDAIMATGGGSKLKRAVYIRSKKYGRKMPQRRAYRKKYTPYRRYAPRRYAPRRAIYRRRY